VSSWKGELEVKEITQRERRSKIEVLPTQFE
jgi:hypothetical protein